MWLPPGVHPDDEAVTDLIQRMGPLPPVADLNRDEILDVISRDKKVANGKLHFVLSAGFGQTQIVDDVTPQEILGALETL